MAQKNRTAKPKAQDVKFIQQNHLDKIGEIAVYYGFDPAQSPEIKKVDLDLSKSLLEGDFIEEESEGGVLLPLHVEEKVALLRMYNEKELHNAPQPVMFYFKEPFKGSTARRNSVWPRYADLEVIGATKSVAEATLIQTARAMLRDEGYENICVDINSIGDKDSVARFSRDLTNYYRKHINDLHTECRQLLKKDPFDLLSCKNARCKVINESAPKSMNFLSEASRIHFKEVLEYLETLGIPYRINNNLIGNRKYCSETIFEIVNMDYDKKSKDHRTLAIGVRYDGLSKKIGLKREVSGAGISLLIKGNKPDLRKELKKTKRPFATFIQLGFEAKLLSLSVIETLREAKIPVYQSLAKDKLGAQVSMAERIHVPYTIIIGKKEAMEQSVIVRHTDTRSQDTVKVTDLAAYLKKKEGYVTIIQS